MIRVRRVAIFAHFDAEGRVPVHTRRLLDELLDNVECILLVSTRLNAKEAASLDPRISVIVRDNIGYDFYSFRTGVLSIEALYAYDELVIANDSVITVDRGGISKAFQQMEDVACDAWSMTESWQVDRHLQSYFLVFRKSAFFTKYFLDFWKSVRVLHDKWQIILTYEIGLTQWLIQHGARITSAFRPSAAEEEQVRARLREKMLRAGVASTDARPTAEDVKVANPVHFLWEALFQRYGFIKSEVLRDDPNGVLGIDLARLIVDGSTRAEVEAEIQRARRTRPPPVPLGTDGGTEPDEDVLVTHGVGAIDVSRLGSDVAI
jgi:lipopolysaccharide biosynthesis protein